MSSRNDVIESKEAHALPPRHQRFVEALLGDPTRNATQAAIAAGYAPGRASVTACELKAMPPIAAEIAARERALSQRAKITRGQLSDHLVATFAQARQARNFFAVARLGELIARLHGWLAPTQLDLSGEVSFNGAGTRQRVAAKVAHLYAEATAKQLSAGVTAPVEVQAPPSGGDSEVAP